MSTRREQCIGGGSISLGLDENGSPVIFEYKRALGESVINQGLFYLDWLLDHKAEFESLVSRRWGLDASVDWSSPRLICVAGEFTRYDEYAIRQINRNIELVRYRDFGADLLAIERVSEVSGVSIAGESSVDSSGAFGTRAASVAKYKKFGELLEQAGPDPALFDRLDTLSTTLGDDVVRNERAYYVAYRRLRNFACVEVRPNVNKLLVYLNLAPEQR